MLRARTPHCRPVRRRRTAVGRAGLPRPGRARRPAGPGPGRRPGGPAPVRRARGRLRGHRGRRRRPGRLRAGRLPRRPVTRSSPLRPSRTSTPSVPCRVSAPEVPRAIRRRRAVEVALSETRSVTKVRVPAGRPEKTTRRSAPSPSRRSRTPSRDAVPVRSRSAVGPSSPTSSESVPRPSAERRRRSRLIVGEASTASTATVRDTGPEVATPPFAVPPSSARRTGITAVPSAPAAGVNDSTPDGEICGGDANSPGTDGSPRHARPTHRPRMAEQLGRAGDRRREGHGRPEVAEPVGRTDGHRVGAGDGRGPTMLENSVTSAALAGGCTTRQRGCRQR